MSLRYRITWVGVLVLLAFIYVVPAANARPVPPVTHLHLVSGDANRVVIAWNAPAHGSTTNATIDQYAILRDSHQIAIQGYYGSNGLVDTSYADGSPSSKAAVYSVIAIDSTGERSAPASVNVVAPQSAAAPSQTSGQNTPDVIQSSGLCDSIIPPDIRGNNQPTGLEKYGCGSGMNSVNDPAPCADLLVTSVCKHGVQHDFLQTFFIQLPITWWQAIYLANSAFTYVVMQASTYHGIGHLFGSLLQAFHGNPNYPGLVSLAVAIAVIFLTLMVLRGERRKGYFSIGMIIAALTVLTVFLANPFRTMNFAVNEPLGLFSGITNEMTDMTAGTGVANQFNLTVHPTYAGNKTYSSIRKAENIDWLMFQYLPQCAINFDDYNWVMNHDYPGTHTTYCERFVQIWGDRNSGHDQKKKFTDTLKAANNDVGSFFKDSDQGLRVVYTIMSKVALFVHLLMKFAKNMAIFACMLLLLGEMLFSVLWLIYAATGSDSAKKTVEIRIRTMFHWLKVPIMMLLLILVQEAVEANIISLATGAGFLWLCFFELLWDTVFLVVAFFIMKRMHREHKESMERLRDYQRESSDLLTRGALAALTGGAAGVAAEVARERYERSSDGQNTGHAAPTDDTFDFNGFDQEPLMLEAGSGEHNNDGYGYGHDAPPDRNGGGPHWDYEAESDDMAALPQLETVAASSNSQGRSTVIHPDVDVDADVIVDADVVVDEDGSYSTQHDVDTDFSSNGSPSSREDDGSHNEGEDRY